eukprot:353842-Chlamydomonas_euryale.AAC.7
MPPQVLPPAHASRGCRPAAAAAAMDRARSPRRRTASLHQAGSGQLRPMCAADAATLRASGDRLKTAPVYDEQTAAAHTGASTSSGCGAGLPVRMASSPAPMDSAGRSDSEQPTSHRRCEAGLSAGFQVYSTDDENITGYDDQEPWSSYAHKATGRPRLSLHTVAGMNGRVAALPPQQDHGSS